MVKKSAESFSSLAESLAQKIAHRYGELPQVKAVALGGSLACGTADVGSDVDVYVYLRGELAVSVRAGIAMEGGERVEVDNRFWESGDEWMDVQTGVHVDVMFRAVEWIEEQLDRVLRRCEASVGYSTCLWHNVASSRALYDRAGWFRALQRDAEQAYPEELRRAIVAKNHPILWRTASSYKYQLEGAIVRGDLVSVNHRVAALLASYFDVLFAVNRLLHPGEKRLVEIALAQCERLPTGMEQQVNGLIRAVSRGDESIIEKAGALVRGLDDLLEAEGFDLFESEC